MYQECRQMDESTSLAGAHKTVRVSFICLPVKSNRNYCHKSDSNHCLVTWVTYENPVGWIVRDIHRLFFMTTAAVKLLLLFHPIFVNNVRDKLESSFFFTVNKIHITTKIMCGILSKYFLTNVYSYFLVLCFLYQQVTCDKERNCGS